MELLLLRKALAHVADLVKKKIVIKEMPERPMSFSRSLRSGTGGGGKPYELRGSAQWSLGLGLLARLVRRGAGLGRGGALGRPRGKAQRSLPNPKPHPQFNWAASGGYPDTLPRPESHCRTFSPQCSSSDHKRPLPEHEDVHPGAKEDGQHEQRAGVHRKGRCCCDQQQNEVVGAEVSCILSQPPRSLREEQGAAPGQATGALRVHIGKSGCVALRCLLRHDPLSRLPRMQAW